MKNEIEFKKLVAENLAYYRKANNLTQIELAEKLNYSDKSISKWERGEGIPDIYILYQIAGLLGVKLNDLFTERKVIPKFYKRQINLLVTLLAFGGVWLVATIAFALLGIFLPNLEKIWLAFVYAIPISTIVLIVFSNLWGRRSQVFISLTILYWTTPLALFLTFSHQKLFLLFIMVIPLQILTIIWFLLRRKKYKKPLD